MYYFKIIFIMNTPLAEKVKKWLNWLITIATAATVLIDKLVNHV